MGGAGGAFRATIKGAAPLPPLPFICWTAPYHDGPPPPDQRTNPPLSLHLNPQQPLVHQSEIMLYGAECPKGTKEEVCEKYSKQRNLKKIFEKSKKFVSDFFSLQNLFLNLF